jgi:hypothetical protein
LRQFIQGHIRPLGTVLIGLAFAASVAAGATLAKHPTRRLTVVLTPSHLGTVRIAPGGKTCSGRCVVRYRKGTRIRIRVAQLKGATFAGWSGACSGDALCRLRLSRARRVVAHFAAASPLSSWNPHTACTAELTTLPTIIGSVVGPYGGALEPGGAFQPHLHGNADRHMLNPPCAVGTEPTFVQINGVIVGKDWDPVRSDGDYTGTLADGSRPDITNAYMKAVHAEIDGTWFKAGVAPLDLPPAGTKVDVQGFIYWDPGHATERFHNFSGWELHPLSAWRISQGPNNRAQSLGAIFPAGAVSPGIQREDGNSG